MKMLYNIVYANGEFIMRKDEIIQNDQIRLAAYLKISQLKREQLNTLKYTHIMNVLFHYKWRDKLPLTMNAAIDDIMSLTASEVVKILHLLAIVDASSMKLDDIETILGGESHG